ncbi:MAG: GNAT family N-acetyltransferase [Nocardioidaceae bacterium]
MCDDRGPGRQVAVARIRFDDPQVQTLVARVQEEYVVRYGSPDDTPFDGSVFEPGAGAFFVATEAGAAVAMGGWRFRGDVSALGGRRTAELKRMYVVPEARRHGLARVVLAHLERTAAREGADLMVLETGIEQPEALALYEATGYVPVPKFGHYAWSPKSRCLGKRLSRRTRL